MTRNELHEIEIPDCYRGRVDRFNNWRRAVADMTGVRLSYAETVMPVALKSEGPAPPPAQLPFIVAAARSAPLDSLLTPENRLGRWPELPAEPLWILLGLTVPSGIIRHQFAGAIALRLGETTELMYGIDDGSFGLVNLGRFTESMSQGMGRIAERRTDAVVQGGFEPSGWWTFSD
jgi:hypothetical protein